MAPKVRSNKSGTKRGTKKDTMTILGITPETARQELSFLTDNEAELYAFLRFREIFRVSGAAPTRISTVNRG